MIETLDSINSRRSHKPEKLRCVNVIELKTRLVITLLVDKHNEKILNLIMTRFMWSLNLLLAQTEAQLQNIS